MDPSTGSEREKDYMTTLTFTCKGKKVEQVQADVEKLFAHLENAGFTLIEGHTHVCIENKPIEQVTYGSTRPFRNMAAQRGWTGAEHINTEREELISGTERMSGAAA